MQIRSFLTKLLAVLRTTLLILSSRQPTEDILSVDRLTLTVMGVICIRNKSDFANSVRQTSDGGYVVAGQTESAGAGRYDMWIFKLDNNGNQEPTGIYTQRYIDPYRLSLSQNYPNPFSQSTTIAFILPEPGFVTLTVFDIFRKEKETIFRGYLPPGESKAEWTPGNLSVGVYYYRLQLGQFVKTKSLVLLR
jgi:hypothetical protein